MCSKTSIKTRLREIREAIGIARQRVSDDTGIPFNTIVSWEHGKTIPTLTNIEPLAKYYGVSVDYILGRTDNPKINY